MKKLLLIITGFVCSFAIVSANASGKVTLYEDTGFGVQKIVYTINDGPPITTSISPGTTQEDGYITVDLPPGGIVHVLQADVNDGHTIFHLVESSYYPCYAYEDGGTHPAAHTNKLYFPIVDELHGVVCSSVGPQ